MHRLRSRTVRVGARLLLVLCGAALGLAQDNWPSCTGAAVAAVAVAFVLCVMVELAQAEKSVADAVGDVVPEPGEPADEPDVELCDFCDRAESRTAGRWGLDLPEGWLAVEIDRRAAAVLSRTYCSEEHLQLDLAGPLPAPEPFRGEPWEEAPQAAGGRLTCLALGLGLCLLAGFLLLGCVLAVRFLVGLL